MYTLHKLKECFIITSDEELKEGELKYDVVTKKIETSQHNGTFRDWKKIIATESQIDFSNLTVEQQKEIGWFDAEKIAIEIFNQRKDTHTIFWKDVQLVKEGVQKALEILSDNKFNLEDIKSSVRYGFDVGFCSNSANKIKNNLKSEEEFIESISNKSWKVELEMGVECQSQINEPCLCLEKFTHLREQCKKPKLKNEKFKITSITY